MIIDKDCIYCRVGGTCEECKLKYDCKSYLEKLKEKNMKKAMFYGYCKFELKDKVKFKGSDENKIYIVEDILQINSLKLGATKFQIVIKEEMKEEFLTVREMDLELVK